MYLFLINQRLNLKFLSFLGYLYKNVKMKNIIKLNEQDLERLVKKILKEDIQNNKLYNDLNTIIRNSNASRGEIIDVLKYILSEKEGRGFVTKEKALKNLGK